MLAGFLIFLVLAHILSVIFQNAGHGNELTHLFDVDNERNIPTVYNGLLWGCSALIVFLLMLRTTGVVARLRWLFLSALFFYFAFDEILVLHESMAEPIRDLLSIGNDSVFYHAWIVPAIAITVAITLLTLYIKGRDSISREQKIVFRLLVILAFGVVVLEAAGTQIYFSQTAYKLGPVLVEETFEMGMISLILYKASSFLLFVPSKNAGRLKNSKVK